MQADQGTFTLRAEASDAESLRRVQDLVTGHLDRFSRRDRNRVVRSFKTIVGPAIEPFTDQQFRDMGVRPLHADLARVDTLEELVAFSTSIESWHNTTHMAIGTRPGRR